MSKASLPLTFWPFGFATAVFTINRLPSPILTHKFPFELLFHRPPDYTILKTFGCAFYPLLKRYSSHKLEPNPLDVPFLVILWITKDIFVTTWQ